LTATKTTAPALKSQMTSGENDRRGWPTVKSIQTETVLARRLFHFYICACSVPKLYPSMIHYCLKEKSDDAAILKVHFHSGDGRRERVGGSR
jgi:hypothetical protein